MSYWGELRSNIRPLVATTMGIGFGISINNYTSSLFGAHLIREFGWQKSDFAKIGIYAIFMLFTLPLAGRLADRLGVRKAASIGIFGIPPTFIALSMMSGNINMFFAINLTQILIGSFTTSTVYNRIVAERFVSARGIAFAIVMSGPPFVGALAAPILGDVIDAYGWRVGYLSLGGLAFCFSLVALLLMPAKSQVPVRAQARAPSTFLADFGKVSRNRTFWLIVGSMFLCNLPQALGSSQLMIMLAENGVSLKAAGFLSLYPAGVIIGRFVSGAAMDRFPAQIVGAIGLALPAFGFAFLAGPSDNQILVGLAVLMMGLAQGAEGDVAAFLVGQHFPLGIFATTLGLVGAGTAVGSSVGALVVSQMLGQWNTFVPFLIFSAIVTLLGAVLLLFVRRIPQQFEPALDQPLEEGVVR